MKRNCFLLIALLFTGLYLSAQQSGTINPPDAKKISKQLSKEPGLYSKLLKRYMDNDTTLTIENYHLIYYGYALQSGFDPNKTSSLRDSLTTLFRNANQGNADYKSIKELSKRILEQLPFDIRTLDPAIYAYERSEDPVTAMKLQFRMGRIIETIFNSGDGQSQTSPFFIVSIPNIADMVRALGFSLVSDSPETSGDLYFMRVKENEFGIQGFYFRVFGR